MVGAGEAQAAGAGPGLRRLEPEAISAEAGRQLTELLAGWCEKHPEVQVSEDVIHGHPGQVLAALSVGMDLVILGRQQRSGTERPGIGSVQHAVLNHAHGPVAVVPFFAESLA
jgi:nucleotide-binding universal stress UspA family protein